MGWTIRGLKQGVEDAIQGIVLVFQNPSIRQQKHLKIFAYLSILSFVLVGIVRLAVVAIPIYLARLVLLRIKHDATHLEPIRNALDSTVSSIPSLLAILFTRYVYPKPLDTLFIEQLRYVDSLHPDRPSYAAALLQQQQRRQYRQEHWANMKGFLVRTWKKVRLGAVLYLLSRLPRVGPFVFPAAGAYATFRALGRTQAVVVGICFLLFLQRETTISLIRALIGMRALMRELLEPYFVRLNMSHEEKRRWFSGRKDVLFGFSAIAYILIRLPVVGFVGYGVAQAAAAYMLTVVTDPPVSVYHKRE